ncbi:MAG: hypothetical protein GMKNLPBB_00174 [Myxococcota bacterium]|nr:hypothetical protein [Myxococcota bacterium]
MKEQAGHLPPVANPIGLSWNGGLHLAHTPFWIDSIHKRAACLVSSHEPGARHGHQQIYCPRGVAEAGNLLKREGVLAAEHEQPFITGDTRFQWLPCGAHPASAMLLIETRGRRMLYLRQVRLEPPLYSPPPVFPAADILAADAESFSASGFPVDEWRKRLRRWLPEQADRHPLRLSVRIFTLPLLLELVAELEIPCAAPTSAAAWLDPCYRWNPQLPSLLRPGDSRARIAIELRPSGVQRKMANLELELAGRGTSESGEGENPRSAPRTWDAEYRRPPEDLAGWAAGCRAREIVLFGANAADIELHLQGLCGSRAQVRALVQARQQEMDFG